MKIQVQSIHFDASNDLQEYVQKKCDKLDTFFDRITDARMILKLNKDAAGENKIAELILNVPSEQLVATEKGRKFEEAVDLATENMKRQLKRFKDKMRAHH